MNSFGKCLLLWTLTLLPAVAAQPYTFNFGAPVVLAPTETPGAWYPDRFPPNGFVSPVIAPDGTQNTLQESIAASDLQPGVSFYNTQGRKYDIPPSTTSVTIWLYVPAAWATQPTRDAGFWTTVLPNTGSGDFPIIEFQGPIPNSPTPTSGPSFQPNGGVPGFYGWNNVTGLFQFIGLPKGFAYNTFVELNITFLPPNGGFVYTVGTGSAAVSLNSPQSVPNDTGIGNVILEGYNYGSSYSIYWYDPPVFPADSYQLFVAANLTAGDSYIDITNSGVTGAGLSTGTTASVTGAICANVYAFAPDEQLMACCSCPITPNGSATLDVDNDLLLHVLEPQLGDTAMTIALTATAPVGGNCTGSAYSVASPLVSGLAAWGSTLHLNTSGTPAYRATGKQFVIKPLTTAEYDRITTLCAFAISNGGGAGICNSCTPGALGASKK